MSETLRYVPPEERGERPLPKTADFRYAYRGYWSEGGICRVRLFGAEDRTPIVVVSQLDENRNTSVTNMAEYLAAEIGAKCFPHRFEMPAPFTWLEHYRHPEERDPDFRELWSRVTFDTYTPRLVMLGGVVRTRLGIPRWTHMSPEAVSRLIGKDEMRWREEAR